MRIRPRLWPCLVALLAVAVPQATSAQPSEAAEHSSDSVRWRAEWRSFNWIDASITAAGLGTQVTLEYAAEPPARWRGPILFDGAVQRTLVAPSSESRHRWRLLSDVTLGASVGHAVALDPLLTWLAYDDGYLAAQMAGMALQSIAVTGGLTGIVKVLAGRSRPPPPRCRGRPTAPDCPERENRSFFSGHTALAFAGFSTFAVVHARLPIYGEPWDGVASGAYGVVAAATGLLRIVGNRHYASDVLVGAIVGTTIGTSMPLLLHLRGGGEGRAEPTETDSVEMSLRPGLGTGGIRTTVFSIRW